MKHLWIRGLCIAGLVCLVAMASAAPVADFTANVTSGIVPFAVGFTDQSTGSPDAWTWSFGDGNISHEQNPVHLYTGPGTYDVSLNASGATGSDLLARPGYIGAETPDFTLGLSPGWNFVSVPVALAPGHDTASVFSGIDTGGHSIWTYDGKDRAWVALNETSRVALLDGIWIYSTRPDSVSLKFDLSAISAPKECSPGWNAIGFPDTVPAAARDALVSVEDEWTTVIGYDAPLRQYEVSIIRGGSGGHVDSREMKPGKGYWLFMDGGGAMSPSFPSYPIDRDVRTTLDRTVNPVPVPESSPKILPFQVSLYQEYGYGAWEYGAGLPYEKRLDLMGPGYDGSAVTGSARLLRFFDMTDIHISDKETPTQGIYFGYLGLDSPGFPPQSSGYSPVMLSSTQVLDAAVQTVNVLNKAEPFDFGISLGDSANNEQFNELRWYIDVLDGRMINPDSGAKDDPVPGPRNDYQDMYRAAGLDPSIPWYQARGNHDHLWIGTNPPDDYLKENYTGTLILNMGNIFTDPLGIKSRGFYMGAIDGRTPLGEIIGVGNVSNFTSPPEVPAADMNRHVVTPSAWMGEFFNTTSNPVGHGFDQAGAEAGFACYSFEPRSDVPLKVIVLDDTQNNADPDAGGYGHGSLDRERYEWLVSELDTGQAEGKLMIIAAHVPIGVEPNGSSIGWSPIAYVNETTLMAQLHQYPNLLLWIAGHRHNNMVTALKSTDNDPERGFWEVETSSLRDFPQQFRTFGIVRNSDDTVSIFVTDVDPSVGDGSIAAKSRSYGVATLEIFNHSATTPFMPTGSCNAELVKQLTPEMQEKIRDCGTPVTF